MERQRRSPFRVARRGGSPHGRAQAEDRRLTISRIDAALCGTRNITRGEHHEEALNAERPSRVEQEEVRLLDERPTRSGGFGLSEARERPHRKSTLSQGAPVRWWTCGDRHRIKARIEYGETGNRPVFGQKSTLLDPQLGGTWASRWRRIRLRS